MLRTVASTLSTWPSVEQTRQQCHQGMVLRRRKKNDAVIIDGAFWVAGRKGVGGWWGAREVKRIDGESWTGGGGGGGVEKWREGTGSVWGGGAGLVVGVNGGGGKLGLGGGGGAGDTDSETKRNKESQLSAWRLNVEMGMLCLTFVSWWWWVDA